MMFDRWFGMRPLDALGLGLFFGATIVAIGALGTGLAQIYATIFVPRGWPAIDAEWFVLLVAIFPLLYGRKLRKR